MRVAICSPSIEPGDAVSNDVLGEVRCLAAIGVETRLFGHESRVPGLQMSPMGDLRGFVSSEDDLLVYHYAIGWGEALTAARDVRCRIVLKYHNVTPPAFFHGVNADYERVCAAGVAQLAEWTHLHPWRYVGDSRYNVERLIAVGADPACCRVCPPYSPVENLQRIDADMAFLDRLDDGSINILSVGRLAPNKNHAAAIRAFAEYNAAFRRDSRLVIVGAEDSRLRPYVMDLHELCRLLGVKDRVLFAGKIPDNRLKAAYMMSRLLLSTSLHEGFCVPAVEAMSMSVPIVAVGAAAVAETVGDAGLVWNTEDVDILAASIDRVVVDGRLSAELERRGRHRFSQTFSTAAVDGVFSGIVEESS